VRYLMSTEGGEFRRWIMLGTESVCPTITNRILSAYLASEGVQPDEITTIYVPLSHSDWREIVQRIKTIGLQGPKTAVVSMISGGANGHLYTELAAQQVDAKRIPVMALSVSERELQSAEAGWLNGHMAARNYFQSVASPENDAFVKMWTDVNNGRDRTTNDPMEAALIGFRMLAQAVTQAGTTDVNAVRQAMYGQRIKAPSSFEVVMNINHHVSKPAMIGKLNPTGTFKVVWRSMNPIKASVWSRYIPESARLTADWKKLRQRAKATSRSGEACCFKPKIAGSARPPTAAGALPAAAGEHGADPGRGRTFMKIAVPAVRASIANPAKQGIRKIDRGLSFV
jgi:urea transport system substrate-binding protein